MHRLMRPLLPSGRVTNSGFSEDPDGPSRFHLLGVTHHLKIRRMMDNFAYVLIQTLLRAIQEGLQSVVIRMWSKLCLLQERRQATLGIKHSGNYEEGYSINQLQMEPRRRLSVFDIPLLDQISKLNPFIEPFQSPTTVPLNSSLSTAELNELLSEFRPMVDEDARYEIGICGKTDSSYFLPLISLQTEASLANCASQMEKMQFWPLDLGGLVRGALLLSRSICSLPRLLTSLFIAIRTAVGPRQVITP